MAQKTTTTKTTVRPDRAFAQRVANAAKRLPPAEAFTLGDSLERAATYDQMTPQERKLLAKGEGRVPMADTSKTKKK